MKPKHKNLDPHNQKLLDLLGIDQTEWEADEDRRLSHRKVRSRYVVYTLISLYVGVWAGAFAFMSIGILIEEDRSAGSTIASLSFLVLSGFLGPVFLNWLWSTRFARKEIPFRTVEGPVRKSLRRGDEDVKFVLFVEDFPIVVNDLVYRAVERGAVYRIHYTRRGSDYAVRSMQRISSTESQKQKTHP